MVLVKLCIAFVTVSCLGCWCQGEDQPEMRIINGEGPIAVIQSSPQSLNIREGKHQHHKSPNTQIENFYKPHRAQNRDNYGQGYYVYPYKAFPTIAQYYSMNEDTDILEKQTKVSIQSKPLSTESQIPDSNPQKPNQEPKLVYGQMMAEQHNEMLNSPYTLINRQNALASILSSTGGKYPYFFIINSPYSVGPNIPKLPSSSAAVEDEDSQVESTAETSKPTKTQALASHPYLKVSQQSFDNLGLSVAKYVLGHPLYSANDMEGIRSHTKVLVGANKREEEEHFKDSEDDDVIEVEADDDYIPEADELTTKDVKLPFEFLWNIDHPEKKVDDRVAVLYLRHTKKGRNMQLGP